MSNSLVLQDDILVQAQQALLDQGQGVPFCANKLPISPSGAICLYEKGWFPWKGLPYPHEHARLGRYLAQLGHMKEAQRLAHFQRAMLDHKGCPIRSVFCQEGKVSFTELKEVTEAFFALCLTTDIVLPVMDPDLGFFRMGDDKTTALITAAACRTGLGYFAYRDAAVITFGPQLTTVGDCSGFGMAGRPQDLFFMHQKDVLECRYRNRLACVHERSTGISFLSDAGYTGLWIDVEHTMQDTKLRTLAKVLGPGDASELSWVFFGQAKTCVVAKSHVLSSNSLDRYRGPIQSVEMRGHEGSVLIAVNTPGDMEVIPLAGDESFWGSDFLVVLRPQNRILDCEFTRHERAVNRSS